MTAGCQVVVEILPQVGDKWSIQVVTQLGAGPQRFNALRRLIAGISQRMLTLTLRGLERDGLVARTVYPTIPPKVDYALTERGRSLLKIMNDLEAWAHEHRDAILESRRRFDEAGVGDSSLR